MAADRVLLLALLAMVVAGAVLAGRWWARRKLGQLKEQPAESFWTALGAEPDGRPAIVAFSTVSCAACRTAQSPAIEALRVRVGDESLRVFHIDAGDRPGVAQAFGVMTVPTTVVLRPEGAVAAVNHGFAPTDQLARQLAFSA